MKSFAFDVWDGGRLTVNREFAPLLAQQRPDDVRFADGVFPAARSPKTCSASGRPRGSTCPTNRASRGPSFSNGTDRPPLVGNRQTVASSCSGPFIGARNEWDAILRFHEAGIATMVPVALGESRGRSFLLTAAIEGCRKLTEWMARASGVAPQRPAANRCDRSIAGVADVARTMHSAGLHHQDFYLTHLMVPLDAKAMTPSARIHVLDLGRVRWHAAACRAAGSSRTWASSTIRPRASRASDRLRFLTAYLGRPVAECRPPLIRRMLGKSRAIARHSQKNGL